MMRQIMFIFIMLWSHRGSAGTITAELDRNRIDAGEQAILTVTISGSLKDDLEIPQVEGLDFRQSGTSTNVQIINGSISKETAYAFEITPLKTGTFIIPSFKVNLDKEDVATPPLNLIVTASGAVPTPGAPQGHTSAPAQAESSDPIVIERTVEKLELYDGEAVRSTVRILRPLRLRVTGMVPERDAAPDWRIISKDGQKSYNTTRDGMPWHVTELQEVLVPLKSGSLELPKFSLRVTYVQATKRSSRRTGTIWDMLGSGVFDMGEEVSKKISSATQKVKVLALPKEGRPGVVSDMVGSFKVDTSVSKRELNPQETATVTVTISGRGALDRMVEIKPPILMGAKIYSDKPQLSERITDDGLYSEKVIKFAVVPSGGGILDLGALQFGVFDPGVKKWATLTAEMGTINVSGSPTTTPAPESSAGVTVPSPNPSDAQTNHNQIQSPTTSQAPAVIPSLKPESAITERSVSTTSWFAMAAAVVGVCAVFFAAAPLKKKLAGGKASRMRDPFSHLKDVSKNLTQGNVADGIYKLKAAVVDSPQFADALTAKDVGGLLVEKGVATDVAFRVESALLAIEACSYRDRAVSDTEVEQLRSAIDQLARAECKLA